MKKALIVLWQSSVIAIMCAALVASTACTPQQKLAVVTDIKNLLPAITNVADAVCAFTPAAPICIGGVTAVTASAAVLDTALVNYFTAEAKGTVPPGIIALLNQAITTFESDAGNILGAVHVLDPAKQAEIEAIASATQLLLGVVESLLPATVVTASLKFAASKPVGGFSLNAWVGDYNSKVATLERTLPRTVKLKRVHAHSVVARYATLGLLK